jgi:hypothetical protein
MDPALLDALASQFLVAYTRGTPVTYEAGKDLYKNVMVATKAWARDHKPPSRRTFKAVMQRVSLLLAKRKQLSTWRWAASGADVFVKSYGAFLFALRFHDIPVEDEEKLKLRILNVDEITAQRPSEMDAFSGTQVIVPSRARRAANRWVHHGRVCTRGSAQHHGGGRHSRSLLPGRRYVP